MPPIKFGDTLHPTNLFRILYRKPSNELILTWWDGEVVREKIFKDLSLPERLALMSTFMTNESIP